MTIYIFILFIFLLFYSNNRYYINLILIILFLLSVFRSINVGTDYYNYKIIYETLSQIGINEQIEKYKSIYDNLFTETRTFEPLFYFIYFLFNKIGISFFSLNVFLSAIFLILANHISKKFSVSHVSSLVLFFLLFYYFMFFNTNRQAFAILFSVLSFYNYGKNKVYFFIFSILAFSSHFSSLIFLILIPFFKYFNFSKRLSYIAILISFLIGFLITKIGDLGIGFYGLYTQYFVDDYSFNYVLLYNLSCMMIYFVFSFFYKKKYTTIVNIWILGLILQNLFLNFLYLYRISDYFLIFQVLAIPLIFFNTRNKNILIFMSTLFFLYNLILNRQGVVPYEIYL